MPDFLLIVPITPKVSMHLDTTRKILIFMCVPWTSPKGYTSASKKSSRGNALNYEISQCNERLRAVSWVVRISSDWSSIYSLQAILSGVVSNDLQSTVPIALTYSEQMGLSFDYMETSFKRKLQGYHKTYSANELHIKYVEKKYNS